MTETNPSRVRYENSQPILRVENMEASLRFYVGVLGFANASWGNQDFTSVNRRRSGDIPLPRRTGTRRCLGLAWGRGRRGHLPGLESLRRADPNAAHQLLVGARDADRRSGRERAAVGVGAAAGVREVYGLRQDSGDWASRRSGLFSGTNPLSV